MSSGESSGASGRRTERVSLRIPIQVKGTDADGTFFHERTFTLIINRDGARICSNQKLVPGSEVTITNLQTKTACSFRVVSHVGRSLGEGPEWGVECLEPGRGIWGIYFPSQTEKTISESEVDALLECMVCKVREFAKLSLDQFRTLRQKGLVSRPCGQCGVKREWAFAFTEGETEPVPAGQSEESERRRAKRLAVKLPVRIRLEDGRQQVARTEDLSRTGARFVTDLELRQGERIFLVVGYDEAAAQQNEVAARVVWRKLLEGTDRFAYGVQLEGET